MRPYPLLYTALLILVTLPSLAQAACLNDGYAGNSMTKLLAQVPALKRRILSDALRQVDTQNSKLRDQKMKIEAQLDALLAAPEFDKRTYLDKTAKLGTLRAKMSANLDDAIASVAAQFTLQERNVLMKMRHQWHIQGYHEGCARDDEEDNHQPAGE